MRSRVSALRQPGGFSVKQGGFSVREDSLSHREDSLSWEDSLSNREDSLSWEDSLMTVGQNASRTLYPSAGSTLYKQFGYKNINVN